MIISVRLGQLAKALFPVYIGTLVARLIILFNEVQPFVTPYPIVVTVAGISNSSSEMQFRNILPPISVMSEGKVILRRDEHPLNIAPGL